MSAAGKLLFLIGLGASYRISLVGQIGISEIFVFLWAPFIFSEEYPLLRRNGFGTYFTLLFLTLLGCIVASVINHSPFSFFLRGFAQIYSLFAGVVVFHSLLRKEPQAIRWLALGLGVSGLLSFVLRGGDISFDFDMTRGGMKAFSRMSVLSKAVNAPIAGWYFDIPLGYSSLAPILFGIICLATSASGRSLALTMMGTGVLAFVGKKNMSKVVGISKHFTQFCISIIVILFLFKTAYVYSARRGYLGELSRIKIEHQTRGKNGTFALLMGGRPEFFSGVYVALKKPILGFGPWAFDTEGYEEEFYEKYATQSAYEDFLRGTSLMKESGYTRIVSGHSHLIGFWSWYGIFGLFFWIYVLWQLYMLFRKNIGYLPVFFGFVCVYAPFGFWSILFSPFSQRMQTAALITVVLLMNNEGRKRRLGMAGGYGENEVTYVQRGRRRRG